MNIRNAKYTKAGTIECEFEHPEFGWIPFHARPDDSNEQGRKIYEDVVASGSATPFIAAEISEEEQQAIALEKKRNRMNVSMRQARLALLQEGLLSSVEGALNALPEPDRSAALIEWEYATRVRRASPLVEALTTALSLTPEQLDDLFNLAATL